MTNIRLWLSTAIMGLASLVLASPASAALSFTLDDLNSGVATTTLGVGTNTVIALAAVANGEFTVNGAAVGEDGLGLPASMDMTTVTITATGPGDVRIIFSMSGVDSPTGPGTLAQSITGQFWGGATGSIEFTSFGDNANTLYSAFPLVPAPTVATPTVLTLPGSSSVAFIADSQYSLTQILVIHFTSAGSVSLSSDAFTTFNVPEPSTLVMFGISAVGMGLGAVRRRSRKTT